MKLYVSENLKRLRKEKGLTQEQLATRLSVSFQAVPSGSCGDPLQYSLHLRER